MPGNKYTDKQERKADHIEKGYENRGVPRKEAKRRAWATVNKDDHGGKNPGGSGRGKTTNHPASARSRSARKATATPKRRGH
jgi:plasmid stabilization system protein ParE